MTLCFVYTSIFFFSLYILKKKKKFAAMVIQCVYAVELKYNRLLLEVERAPIHAHTQLNDQPAPHQWKQGHQNN